MSSSSGFLPPVIVGLVSGAASAMLVVFLNSEPTPSVDASGGSLDSAALHSRIADLELLAQDHAVALDALSLQQPSTGLQRQAFDGPSRAEFNQLQARLDELMLGSADAPESLSSNRLDSAIAGVIEQREEEERLERERIVEEKRLARLDNQVNLWTEKLGLSDVQAIQMREMLDNREQARQEVMAAIRSGEMNKADAGAPWQQIDSDYRQGLGAMLTPQQMETLESSGGMAK